MMVETVRTGTAKKLGVSAGGKTGTAEGVQKGKDVVHSWFTGFIPEQNPQYTITVFVENGGTGSKTAVPIFKQVAELLLP